MAIGEDTEPRYVNHFYDPIYKNGWSGEHAIFSQDAMREMSDIAIAPVGAVSALNWVHNQELQAEYQRYLGNKTWEKAIYEYVKNKNKQEAYYALGHVLHLLEDMAVPEHTRNDTHTPLNESPYENYSARYTRDNFYIVDEIKNQKQPVFNSLDEYFEYLANYSNNYFFSRDTINDGKYNKPQIIGDDGQYGYALDIDQQKFKVALENIQFLKQGENFVQVKNYIIEDKPASVPILNAYWTRLSREAVLSGAGVINLFFKEVEEAEKDPSLLKPPPENQSAMVSFYGEIFKVKNTIVNVANVIGNTAVNLWNSLAGVGPAAVITSTSDLNANIVKSSASDSGNVVVEGVVGNSISNTPPPAPSVSPPQVVKSSASDNLGSVPNVPAASPVPGGGSSGGLFIPSLPYPGFGGGSSASSQNVQQEQQNTSELNEPEDVAGGEEEVVENEEEANEELRDDKEQGEENEEGGGGGEEGDEEFDEGEVDEISPDISFSITECDNSFSDEGCVVSASELHLVWSTTADDLDYFELNIGGETFATTSASTIIFVSDNSILNISVRAKDISENWSDNASQTVEISFKPVVINEIAWGGTLNHSADEWIELYNRSSYPISFKDWILFSQTDMKPYINLTGQIPAKGYYLIERTDDNTVSDIAGDWFGSFGANGGGGAGLSNSGEVLILSHASTTIDQTAVMPNGLWAGGNASGLTMEKIDPNLNSEETSSWMSNNNLIKNGTDSDGNFISGTPKARNSANYLLNNGNATVASDLTLVAGKSPYLVNNQVIAVQLGATLTIEPGVVIKFYNDAGLNVGGKIIAQGAEETPIVFTSFYDDEYGNDINNDAGATLPNAGDWYGVAVNAGNDSAFDYATFRYGGKWYNGVGNSMANLSVENISVSITNSIFEYSKVYGLKLFLSDSVVSNNIFRLNDQEPAGYASAILAIGGDPKIKNNQFLENKIGLYLASATGVVESNYFESNIEGAIYSSGTLGTFNNNSGANNGLNSINIWGNLTQAGDSITLNPNPLPYTLKGYETPQVVASSVLTIGNGAVIKSIDKGISVYGSLVIDGENSSDIVFTSLYDDSIGGDTNNDADSTLPAPGQFPGIFVADTGSLDARGFTMRYAGSNSFGGNNSAGVMVYGGVADISNALFNSNYPFGIFSSDSPNVKIENARFENHNFSGPWGQKAAAGLFNSAVVLNNVSFADNALGIMSDTLSTFVIDAVEFLENIADTLPVGLW